MGFWDIFGFGKKSGGGETISPQPLMPSWQSGVGNNLSSWINQYLSQYHPGEAYSGQLSIKQPSSYENQGLGLLDSLLKAPNTGDLYSAASNQLMDTLSGKFADPSTSPFIKAMTTYANQSLGDAIDQSRATAGARGNFFSTAALRNESNLSERTQNFLNTVVGDFIQGERGRQIQAVPLAQDLEKYGSLVAPLSKIEASMTAGALPRLLEQADLERQYKEYQRQRTELSGVPTLGANLLGADINYGYPNLTAPQQSQTSGLSSILQTLSGAYTPSYPTGQKPGAGGWETDWMDLALKFAPIFLAAA